MLGSMVKQRITQERMMTATEMPRPAAALAAESPLRWPNESAHYRAARTALLADEIALRRQIERVSETIFIARASHV